MAETGNPPILNHFEGQDEPLRELHEDSFVFFRGDLYGLFVLEDTNSAVILINNLERNVETVLALGFGGTEKAFKLFVAGNRMFMGIRWSDADVSWDVFRLSEIRKIFVNESSSTSVVKFTEEEFEQVFAETGSSRYEKFSSRLLMNANYHVLLSGAEESYTYDLRSGAVAALPQHPLLFGLDYPVFFPPDLPRVAQATGIYYAKLSKLSLRSVL